MVFFLSAFLAIYGGGHLYLLARARGACRLAGWPTLVLAGWLLLMLAAPVLTRLFERADHDGLARVTALLGYTWMGLLFYFVVVGLTLDGYRVLGFLVEVLVRRPLLPSLSRRPLFLVPLLAAFLTCGYGWFEARDVRLQRQRLVSAKLSPRLDGLRIVQLSDVHLGLLVGQDRLAAILARVREARPDILVATGDLVDGQMDDLTGLARQLAAIRPRFGKYAILGNHEFYAGLDHSVDFLKAAGFVVLRNESRPVADGGLIIAGVDDRRAATWAPANGRGEAALLAGLPAHPFVLFLKHRPQVKPASLGHFDLQLSGHVHGGQLFPFGLLTRLFFPVPVGVLYPLASGTLYVSPGAGTWGPPFRVGAPPLVTCIELKAATRSGPSNKRWVGPGR